MIEITADYTDKQLEDVIAKSMQDWINNMVAAYQKAGKDFVERAVAKASFNNITYNLRSSIGYLIILDGKVIDTYFMDLKDGTEGQEVGKDYAEFIAKISDTGEGLSMALVAGMEYAYYVERVHKKDVIGGSSAYFETELRTLLGV